MGNLYDVLIDLGYEDDEPEVGDSCSHGNSWHSNCSDCDTEIDLDRDVPDNPNEPTFEDWPTDSPTDPTFEHWVESMIGEPEYLGNR